MRALLALLLALPAAAAPPPCAKEHEGDYREARKQLDAGDPAGAVARLSALRTSCPAPAIDFYLGSAYERLGRLGMAIDALSKYLAAAGGAGNRGEVEAWLGELVARADAEKQGVPPPPRSPRPPPGAPPPYVAEGAGAPAPPPAAAPAADDRWLAYAGLGLAGNGGIVAGKFAAPPIGALGVGY
jgi:hypothetical protein